SWPMSLRPLLYYYADGEDATGCGADECVRAVMMIGTPALWWLSLPMLAWALWKVLTRRDWRYAWILVGYGAGILPWLASLDRQMYFFYAVPLAPFLVLGLVMVAGEVLGPATAPATDGPTGGRRRVRLRGDRRTIGAVVVSLYTALVVVNYVWLWPILTGLPITA